MSHPIQNFTKTPKSHPELFVSVKPKDVRKGDIFQGTKDPKKWFHSEGGHAIDSFRKYWRRKPVKAVAIKKGPVKATPIKRSTENPKAIATIIPTAHPEYKGQVVMLTHDGSPLVVSHDVVVKLVMQEIKAGRLRVSTVVS